MVNIADLKDEAEERIDEIKERMVELSSDLHENPELSFEEYHASEL